MIIECKGTEKFADMQMVLGYTYKFIDWRLCEVPLYNIVVLNTQRFVVFVSKIGEFGEWNGIYNTRKHSVYWTSRVGVFFLKKVFACWILCWKNAVFYALLYIVCVQKIRYFYLNICVCAFFVVPLHPKWWLSSHLNANICQKLYPLWGI